MVEFRLIMKVRVKVRVFPVDSLNKNIPRKKAQLLKTSVSKAYKPSRGILWKWCSENSNKP